MSNMLQSAVKLKNLHVQREDTMSMQGLITVQTQMQRPQRPKMVIHDTDGHGISCGICAYYSMTKAGESVSVYSHFSTSSSEPATTPTGLATVLEQLGQCDLVILDIPVDERNPARYVQAVASHAQFKGKVLWADHHGHSKWVQQLNTIPNVTAIVVGTSYDLALLIPRMYGAEDSFVEKWALLGALLDFDKSVADKVSREVEDVVCDVVDQALKFARKQLCDLVAPGEYDRLAPLHGNVGAMTKIFVERGVEADQLIELAKQVAKPIQVPPYETYGDVVVALQEPQPGTAWKVANKLCILTGAKVAIVPSRSPRTGETVLIIARYWRTSDEVAQIVDQYVYTKFAGRQILGHPGARSVNLMQTPIEQAVEIARQVARELDEMLRQRIYTPRVAHLINDQYVAQAIAEDFKTIIRTLTEILEQMRRMYQEYLELKRRQVELLEKATSEQRRYD